MYVCMYICMYVCMYVCIYVYMYVCMYVYMYVCIYVCMYVCMYVCLFVSLIPRSLPQKETWCLHMCKISQVFRGFIKYLPNIRYDCACLYQINEQAVLLQVICCLLYCFCCKCLKSSG